jgi:hypothetical protein
MDIVAGAVLILLAVVIRRRSAGQRTHAERPSHARMGPTTAFGFGVFSMATNFTSLAVLLPAAKDIASDASNVLARIALVLMLVVLATMPAWIPIATTRFAPGPAERALRWISTLISDHGRQAAVVLIGSLGLVLIGRGTLNIMG